MGGDVERFWICVERKERKTRYWRHTLYAFVWRQQFFWFGESLNGIDKLKEMSVSSMSKYGEETRTCDQQAEIAASPASHVCLFNSSCSTRL